MIDWKTPLEDLRLEIQAIGEETVYVEEPSEGDALIEEVVRFVEEIGAEEMFFFRHGMTWSRELVALRMDPHEVGSVLEKYLVFDGFDQTYLGDAGESWVITFCHDGDLHVSGTSEVLETGAEVFTEHAPAGD